jgi:phosphomannomutase
MPHRILSISGLRGVVGDGLDPEYVTRFAAALGTMFDGGPVVVSRDGRMTGPMLKHAVLSGLLATGCRVIDADIATTPTCGVLITHLKAAGGVQITASHNPVEWNGLKPFSSLGSVFDAAMGQRLMDLLDPKVERNSFRSASQTANSERNESRSTFAYKPWNGIGRVDTLQDPAGPHIQRVLKLIDAQAVRNRRFKVVLDCNHGSGAVATPRLLEMLGCSVHVLGGVADGRFEHTPEPLQENLTALCAAVRKQGADAGFAQDPDADRLAIVDNTGRYIGEELTLALCADYVLPRRPGPFVVNGSTSRVNADIAARHNCPFHRSSVGEAHVVAKMRSENATLGGEGNGGVIEPHVGYVRDSFVSIAYVLAGLASAQRTLAEWADALPRYAIVKDKLTCPREKVDAACRALRAAYSDAQATEGDGLRLDWSDRWVQVRASNTEPILRVIAEAPDAGTARALCDKAMDVVRQPVS